MKKREFTFQVTFLWLLPLWYLNLTNIYQSVIDAGLNTCCKLKLVFLVKRLYLTYVPNTLTYVPMFLFLGRLNFEMRSLSNWKFPDCPHFFGARARQVWRDKSCHLQTHKKNSPDAVCRLGTIMQSIFCAQSGGSIRWTIWKWSRESG